MATIEEPRQGSRIEKKGSLVSRPLEVKGLSKHLGPVNGNGLASGSEEYRNGIVASSDAEVIEPTSWFRLAITTFAENRLALVGLGIVVFMVLFSFVGPLIYHTNQVATNLINENLAPSSAHLLGTSPEGRDELGRLMVGGQSTMEVGLGVGLLATLFGLIYGAFAGYVGGFVDALLMRIVDAMLSIPYLFFVVLLAALVRPNLLVVIFVLSAVSWLSTARLVRGETLSLRERDYVVAARGFGSRARDIIRRHVTPNLLGVVLVNGTLTVANAILAFASITYLGLGPPPPATSWGNMLSTGINNLFDGYWWQLWPAAILIVLTVLAINVIGDGLADVVEVRLQKR
jgi:oligopeptide transport system permease protein